MSKNNVPEVFLPNSLPDVLSNINIPTLPKWCHGCDVDCSWLEHLVEFICKFRMDAWNMMVKILLYTLSFFVNGMLSMVCDFLAFLLTIVSSLIQMVDCNLSSNPWDGCSTNLLRDALDWLDAKDNIVLSWIPGTADSLPAVGLSMIQKFLISFATVLGYLTIIILCIFFEMSPQKDMFIKKIKGVFGDSTDDTSSYGDEDVEDTPDEKTGVRGLKTRKATKKQKKTKKNGQKKKSKQSK